MTSTAIHTLLVAALATTLLVLGGAAPAFAESAPATAAPDSTAPDSTASVRVDSSGPSVRTPSEATLDRYRADADYDYDRNRGTGGETWGDRVWQWITENVLTPLFGSEAGSWVVRIGIYGIIAAVLAWGAYGLYQMSPQRAVKRRDRADGLSADVLDAAARGVNLDAKIDAAVQAGEFRHAVRFLYLRALRHFDERGVIDVRPEKTNHDYLDALRDTPYGDAFHDATRAFDYVWYGDAPIDADRFARIRRVFDRLRDDDPVAT